MKRANLAKAFEIETRLQKLEEALDRAAVGQFKAAVLAVRSNAHGMTGLDSRPQTAETTIPLEQAVVVDLLKDLMARELEELRRLEVEM